MTETTEYTDVWAALTRQARWLADAADRVADLPPARRVHDGADELDVLDERALAVRSLTAACRRDTYEALRGAGWSVAAIAGQVGTSAQAIYKVLGRTGEPPARMSEDERRYWQDMLDSSTAATRDTRDTLHRAQRELNEAQQAWEDADCPEDGEVAYQYERAAVWERHCRQRHARAAQRVTASERELARDAED